MEKSENPKQESFWRIVLSVGAVTVVLYAAAFWGLEWWRARKGPWVVEFAVQNAGAPALIISQPRLGIEQFTVVFAGEAASPTNCVIRFDQPVKTVPWGAVAHQDPISFPGVVTLHMFGHEVEMMPRTLSLNRREVPWRAAGTNVLTAADKLPADQLVRKKYQREIKTK